LPITWIPYRHSVTLKIDIVNDKSLEKNHSCQHGQQCSTVYAYIKKCYFSDCYVLY
jgi:hypothetical protein